MVLFVFSLDLLSSVQTKSKILKIKKHFQSYICFDKTFCGGLSKIIKFIGAVLSIAFWLYQVVNLFKKEKTGWGACYLLTTLLPGIFIVTDQKFSSRKRGWSCLKYACHPLNVLCSSWKNLRVSNDNEDMTSNTLLSQDIGLCSSAIEAPLQFIIFFAMRLKGIVPKPGETSFTLSSENGSFSVSHFEYGIMVFQALSMFFVLTKSWKNIYPEGLKIYFIFLPTFIFFLLSSSVIVTFASWQKIIFHIAVLVVVTHLKFSLICKTNPFRSFYLTPFLSIIFPVCSLPSAWAPIGKKSSRVQVKFLEQKYAFFLLTTIKSFYMLMQLWNM